MPLTFKKTISVFTMLMATLFFTTATYADDETTEQLGEEATVQCGSLSKRLLRSSTGSRTGRLFHLLKGDTNLGGNADFNLRVRSILQNGKTVVKVGVTGFTVTECCKCHNPEFLCGIPDNNSQWKGGAAMISYTAPEHYEFDEIYEGSVLLNERTKRSEWKVLDISAFPHLEKIALKGSYGDDFDVNSVSVRVFAPNTYEFILRRVSDCSPPLEIATPNQISGKAIKNPKYAIVNAYHKNLVLDASASDKNRLQLWSLAGDSNEFVPNANNQKWFVSELGDGFVKISNSHYKNHVLDASAGTKGKVQLFQDQKNSGEYVPNALNQKWKLEPLDNGAYKIRNAYYADMVLDASASDTGKIQIWEDLGDADTYVPYAGNQKWYLVPTN